MFYGIKNENEEYADREWGKVSALGRAVGVLDGSSDRLLGKSLWARVVVKPERIDKNTDKKYGESNDIAKYYLPSERRASLPPTQAAAQASAPAEGAFGTRRPWGQRQTPVDDDIPF